jgi:hypothetical protein
LGSSSEEEEEEIKIPKSRNSSRTLKTWATTARRRSKFPNQQIPQEHWELGEHNWKHMRTNWEHDGNKSIKKFHPQFTRRPPPPKSEGISSIPLIGTNSS